VRDCFRIREELNSYNVNATWWLVNEGEDLKMLRILGGVCSFPVVMLLSATLSGEDVAKKTESKSATRSDRLCEKYTAQASEYVMTVAGSDQPLKLDQKPIFRWQNPARVGRAQIHHGLVFAWTQEGRAEAIGTVFSVTAGSTEATIYHEMHSLAERGLKAVRMNAVQWDTQESGCEFKSFSEAPTPADNERQRASQMKQLVRRFSGYSVNYDQKRWELNLLSQPLYRMPAPQPKVLDQAVFAMISTAGTDPEVLIVIEARPVDGKMHWQYAVCRFTDLKTWVSLDDQQVWSFENGTMGAHTDADKSCRYRFIEAGSIDVP
jgi:hypothetical protein